MIPPDEDAAFVACMENILDLYQQPLDPRFPVVNMDEQSVQLLQESRVPLPGAPGRLKRVDHEYRRNGTASLFVFTEALSGWRRVSVRERRTAVDWAEEVKSLLEEVYRDAEQVILICDNLNTHKLASLYKAFPAAEAQQLSKRLALHHTPVHGSWLNIAEIELSVLTRQCLSRRLPGLRDPKAGDGGVGIAPKCRLKRGRLAVYYPRRTHPTQKIIPTCSNVTKH